MDKDRKQRRSELGAEALADALLKLAGQDEAADDLVERMIATPKENIISARDMNRKERKVYQSHE